MFNLLIKLIIFIILQVRADLGIANHVWQDKRAAIAHTVDNMGDGWISSSYARRMA